MKIVIVFKNGHTFEMECESFSIERSNVTGMITNIEIEGIKDNKLLYVEHSEILYVYRKL